MPVKGATGSPREAHDGRSDHAEHAAPTVVSPGHARFSSSLGPKCLTVQRESGLKVHRAPDALYSVAPPRARRARQYEPNTLPQEDLLAKALSNVSGFPRIGAKRELKQATEGYWSGQRSE